MSTRHLCLPLSVMLLVFALSDMVRAGQMPQRHLPTTHGKLHALLSSGVEGLQHPAHTASAPLILVTNTNDTGPGSFRQALLDANSHVGPDSIAFNLPKSDPGYNATMGVWKIKPLSQLPLITDDGTLIDGESQALFSPGSNPSGPAVELDGSLAGPMDCGLSIICSWTWVRKLAVNRFAEMGIIIAGPGHSFNLIYQCYIGVTPDGKSKAPNLKSGIQIMDANLNFVSWPDTTFTAFANVIGGNGEAGIEILGLGSSLNYVGPNCIGTDLSSTRDLGNTGDGISIKDGAADNAIMDFDFPKFIVIRNNNQAGIRVSGAATVRNLLAAGSITRNGGPGIVLEGGGNGTMQSPSITDVKAGEIDANAPPKSLVLFFRDSEDEGELYVGCAGGVDVSITKDYAEEPSPKGTVAYKIIAKGLKGGHSGVDIALGRANSNKIMFRFLMQAEADFGIRLAEAAGGDLRNAIPRESYSVVLVPEIKAAEFEKFVHGYEKMYQAEFSDTEPDLKFILEKTSVPGKVMNQGEFDLSAYPDGIYVLMISTGNKEVRGKIIIQR